MSLPAHLPGAARRHTEEAEIDRVLRNQRRWDDAVMAGLSYIRGNRQATLTLAEVEAFLGQRTNPLTPSRLCRAAAEAMRLAGHGVRWLPSRGRNPAA